MDRGVYGFRIDGQDKVTFKAFNTSPEELGNDLLQYIRRTPLDEMKKVARGIILVRDDEIPPKKLIKKYAIYADLEVSDKSFDDWYCLLRNTQGDLSYYHDGLEHMLDYQHLLANSLNCLWAFIINLDTEKFEIYRGFNKRKTASGRYASFCVEREGIPEKYFGVALTREIPLAQIQMER